MPFTAEGNTFHSFHASVWKFRPHPQIRPAYI